MARRQTKIPFQKVDKSLSGRMMMMLMLMQRKWRGKDALYYLERELAIDFAPFDSFLSSLFFFFVYRQQFFFICCAMSQHKLGARWTIWNETLPTIPTHSYRSCKIIIIKNNNNNNREMLLLLFVNSTIFNGSSSPIEFVYISFSFFVAFFVFRRSVFALPLA